MASDVSERIRELAAQAALIKAREAQEASQASSGAPPAQQSPQPPTAAPGQPPTPSPPQPPGAQVAPAEDPPGRVGGRFGKGVSGNRKGRPRTNTRAATSQQGAEDIIIEMQELFPIMKNGKKRMVPYFVIMLQQLKMDAIKNPDVRKAKFLLDSYFQALIKNTETHTETVKLISDLISDKKFENDPKKRDRIELIISMLKRTTQPPPR